MNIDLTGKSVLVTGASRGIGKAIAQAFAQSGARVAIHYGANRLHAETLARELGGGAEAFGADLEQSDDVLGLWRQVAERFGRVDVLVNNAGVALSSPLDGEDEAWIADWRRTQAVNLEAASLLCRQAIAHFEARGGGRIINIASRAAFRGDQPPYLAYAASKAGMVAVTRSIARYFGKVGVTAFTIAPGFTRTDMAQDFIDAYGEDYAVSDIALTRLTEPADIAPTVVFLASGLADHATGATIDINAGSYVR